MKTKADIKPLWRPHRDVLGEGPLYSPARQALFWTDIKGPALNRLDLVSAEVSRWDMPLMLGWLIEREGADSFLCGVETGFAWLDLDPLTVTPFFDPEPHLPGNRLNDAKTDAHGAVYAGTMHKEGAGLEGAFYRLASDLSVRKLDSDYGVANGPAFSLDGRVLYHTDSNRRTIYAFDVEPDGGLCNKRAFITFADDWGYPDGMTLDAEGGLWVAHWDGARISRFLPDGVIDRSIAMPCSRPTSIAFAGSDFGRMFVTSTSEDRLDEPLSGALFELSPGVRGLPAGRFAG